MGQSYYTDVLMEVGVLTKIDDDGNGEWFEAYKAMAFNGEFVSCPGDLFSLTNRFFSVSSTTDCGYVVYGTHFVGDYTFDESMLFLAKLNEGGDLLETTCISNGYYNGFGYLTEDQQYVLAAGSPSLPFLPSFNEIMIMKTPFENVGMCEETLAIELLEFDAAHIPDAARVDLTWTTATERNHETFILERSVNGTDFGEIARIGGAGNSSQTIAYHFSDTQLPDAAVCYYRLKSVDASGGIEEHQTIKVNLIPATNWQVELSPNPAGELTYLTHNLPAEQPRADLELYDAGGRLVKSRRLHTWQNNIPVSLEGLESGVYVYWLWYGGYVVASGKLVRE